MLDELKVTPEPGNAEAPETNVAQSTEGVIEDTSTEVKPIDSVDVEELKRKADEAEKLQRELNAREMRINQLEKMAAKVDSAEDPKQYASLIEELKQENETLKAEKEREDYEKQVADYTSEMNSLFEKKLETYPEAVQKAARFNRDKFGVVNIVGDAQYAYQAEKNIGSFLEELSSQLGDSKPEIKVDATNPSVTPATTERDLLEQELAKPEKDRNFQAIISRRLGKRM